MENINWLEEVEKRKDELIEDVFRLIRVRSVREDHLATKDAPVGPGPKAALLEFVKMAQEDGFEVEQFGPWAAHIEVGEGDKLVGVIGHVDVVPEGTGWDSDPYEPVIKDGKLYGRGALDDKGPLMAAYNAIKLLRSLGVEFEQRLRLIAGTDEESGWQCMDYYLEHARKPDYGFSPDAYFPVVNGEKGVVSFEVSMKSNHEVGSFHLVEFKGGLAANMVPENAHAVIKTPDYDILKDDVDHYLKTNPEIEGKVYKDEEGLVHIEFKGKGAHASTPKAGVNAVTHLARLMIGFTFDNYVLLDWLLFIGRDLFEDHDGSKVGINYEHDVMGGLTLNPGIVDYIDEEGGKVVINIRFPVGTDPETIQAQLEKHLEKVPFEISYGNVMEPTFTPEDEGIVATLLDVYNKQTGQNAHGLTIGGATYSKLFPNTVAYGALFPGSEDVMHQTNEFIEVDDLLKATAIYAEAIYRLTRADYEA